MVAPVAIAAAVAKLGGGILAFQESNKQAAIAREETKRSAKIEADAVRKQLGTQYTQLAKSGVSLEGSPLLMLEENIAVGTENVRDIIRAGQAKEKQIRSAGRAALFGSIAGATGSIAGGE